MAIDTSTGGASLASVAGVHPDNQAPLAFGLVGKEVAQLSEAPTVETSLLSAFALLYLATDVGQVLDRDNRACDYGVYDLPTKLMVQVAPKPKLFSRKALEMFLCRAGAFGLKTALEPKVPSFEFAPAALTEESIVRCDGGTNDTEVYSDNLATCLEVYVWQCDHDVQPEPSFTQDKVSRVETAGASESGLVVGGNVDRKYLPSIRGCEAHGGAVSQNAVGASIVANRGQIRMWSRDFAALSLESKRRLDGFGCADAGGADKLGGQGRMLGAKWIVGRLMQLDSVLFLVRKPVQRHRVETGSVSEESPFESVSFRNCWSELKTNRSLHNPIISYATRYCKRKEARAVSSAA